MSKKLLKAGDKVVCFQIKKYFGWNKQMQQAFDEQIIMTVKSIVPALPKQVARVLVEENEWQWAHSILKLASQRQRAEAAPHEFKVGDLVCIPKTKSTGVANYRAFLEKNLQFNNENYLLITAAGREFTCQFPNEPGSEKTYNFLINDLTTFKLIPMKTDLKIKDKVQVSMITERPNKAPVETLNASGTVEHISSAMIGVKLEGIECKGKHGCYWYLPEELTASGVPVLQEKPKSQTATPKITLGLGEEFSKMIENSLQGSLTDFMKDKANFIDEKVRTHIKEEINNIRPIKNYVTINTGDIAEIEGKLHKSFENTLFLAASEKQVFISGPAGSGKTTLCAQVAEALKLNFAHISCSAGMSEAHLLGRMLFDGAYVSSDFVKLYEEGGVFLFDEIDAADSNTLLVINSALANGILSVPNRKDNSHAKRHENFICMVAGNTWGNGSSEYHGRNHLDAAFLDRFALSKIHVDYDASLEKEILGDQYSSFGKMLWDIRNHITTNKIRRILSTRVFVAARRQLAAGKTPKQVLDVYTLGWSEEEKRKVPTLQTV